MGMFDDLATVKTFERTPWFEPGEYEVELDEVKFVNGQQGEDWLILVFKIKESSNEETHLQVGCTASWTLPMSGKKINIGKANYKNFIGILMGWRLDDSNKKWSLAADLLMDKEQYFKGSVFKLECFNKAMKSDPTKQFTVHNWELIHKVMKEKK